MKTKALIAVCLASAFALPVLADDGSEYRWPVDKRVELKDGGTLIVYKDGRTAVQDRHGNPAWRLKADGAVETRTGERVTLNGNAIERLDVLHRAPSRN